MDDSKKVLALHILERFTIHLFSSTGVFLVSLWGFWCLELYVGWWPPLHGWWQMILPALVCLMATGSREIFDVKRGGLVVKSIIDWISWAVGLVLSIYGIYRLAPRLHHILAEIANVGS